MTALTTFDIYSVPKRSRKALRHLITNESTLTAARRELARIAEQRPESRLWIVERTSSGERVVA